MLILASCGNDTTTDSSSATTPTSETPTTETTGSSTTTSGSETPSTTVNYGTEEAPLKPSQLLTEAAKLNLGKDEYSEKHFFVKGYVTTVPTYNAEYQSYNFSFADDKEGTAVPVYGAKLAEGVTGTVCQNDTVLVEGLLENYGGKTLEITYKDSDSPSIKSHTVGTSSITKQENHCFIDTTTEVKDSYANGSTVSFKVTPDTGYENPTVKVNGEALTPTENVYSFVVARDSLIQLSADESGVVKTTKKVTFSDLYTANTVVSDKSMNIGDDASVVFAKGDGTAPQYYTNGTAIRTYAKNTFTITCTYAVLNITLTFSSDVADDNKPTCNAGTYTQTTKQLGEWSGEAKSIVFTVGGSSGHVRISAIEIQYVESAA